MPGPSAKSRPAFDQRAVFCKRHTRHGETDAGRGEGKRRLWRHVVESVLPGGRCVRHNAQRTALARSRPWKWDRRLPRRSDRCRAVRCLLALEEAGEDHGARCRCRSRSKPRRGAAQAVRQSLRRSRRDGSCRHRPRYGGHRPRCRRTCPTSNAEPPRACDVRIHARDKAAEIAVSGSSILVVVEVCPVPGP
jgi:hypothetical protein